MQTYEDRLAEMMEDMKPDLEKQVIDEHSRAVSNAEQAKKNRSLVSKLFKKGEKVEIPPELDDAMINDRVSAKLAEYKTKREKGEINDDESSAPGITMYLHEADLQYLHLQTFVDLGITRNLFADGIVEVYLPKGLYKMMWGACQIYSEKAEEGNELMVFAFKNIVRINADSGERWQNWSVSWDSIEPTEQG